MTIGGSNRLIGVPELSAFLGVPERTVQAKWRAWGLPGYHVGKYVKFRERDVASWLETRAA
jgi:excisionase family DNA binding protein